MTQNSLTGGEVDVRGDNATNLGVVVTAFEIVEPCLGLVLLFSGKHRQWLTIGTCQEYS
ncbi:MAG: hypothetical protein ACI4NQ_00605 [Christensenellales bacterium]